MNQPRQFALFDEHSHQGSRLVAIVAPMTKLTKGQQTFNRLVDKIRRQRELLAEWQAYILCYQQRVTTELEPLRRELCEGQRQMCRLLDGLLTASPKSLRLGQTQRAKLVKMFEVVAQSVLGNGPDEEIEALHDQHAAVTAEESRRAELEMTEAFFDSFLGEDMVKGLGARSVNWLFTGAAGDLAVVSVQNPLIVADRSVPQCAGTRGTRISRSKSERLPHQLHRAG